MAEHTNDTVEHTNKPFVYMDNASSAKDISSIHFHHDTGEHTTFQETATGPSNFNNACHPDIMKSDMVPLTSTVTAVSVEDKVGNQVAFDVPPFDNNLSVPLTTKGRKKKKEYKCSYCSKHFLSQSEMKRHILTHTDDKPYACSVCDKRFNHKGTMLRHAKIHSDEKPYECTICGKGFQRIEYLRYHKTKHMEIQDVKASGSAKVYECDFCERTFVCRTSFSAHLRTHSNEKTYKCKQCGKAFKHRSGLQRHVLIHTGNKKFSCDLCDMKFYDSSDMRKHFAHHLDIKKYKCLHCGKGFVQSSSLSSHLKTYLSHKLEHFLRLEQTKGIGSDSELAKDKHSDNDSVESMNEDEILGIAKNLESDCDSNSTTLHKNGQHLDQVCQMVNDNYSVKSDGKYSESDHNKFGKVEETFVKSYGLKVEVDPIFSLDAIGDMIANDVLYRKVDKIAKTSDNVSECLTVVKSENQTENQDICSESKNDLKSDQSLIDYDDSELKVNEKVVQNELKERRKKFQVKGTKVKTKVTYTKKFNEILKKFKPIQSKAMLSYREGNLKTNKYYFANEKNKSRYRSMYQTKRKIMQNRNRVKVTRVIYAPRQSNFMETINSIVRKLKPIQSKSLQDMDDIMILDINKDIVVDNVNEKIDDNELHQNKTTMKTKKEMDKAKPTDANSITVNSNENINDSLKTRETIIEPMQVECKPDVKDGEILQIESTEEDTDGIVMPTNADLSYRDKNDKERRELCNRKEGVHQNKHSFPKKKREVFDSGMLTPDDEIKCVNTSMQNQVVADQDDGAEVPLINISSVFSDEENKTTKENESIKQSEVNTEISIKDISNDDGNNVKRVVQNTNSLVIGENAGGLVDKSGKIVNMSQELQKQSNAKIEDTENISDIENKKVAALDGAEKVDGAVKDKSRAISNIPIKDSSNEKHADKNQHKSSRKICKHCGLIFEGRPEYRNHLRIHWRDKTFECEECKCSFTKWRDFCKHDCKQPFYLCQYCNKRFLCQKYFHEHTAKTRICEECGMTFCNFSVLQKHLKIVHYKSRKKEKKRDGKSVKQIGKGKCLTKSHKNTNKCSSNTLNVEEMTPGNEELTMYDSIRNKCDEQEQKVISQSMPVDDVNEAGDLPDIPSGIFLAKHHASIDELELAATDAEELVETEQNKEYVIHEAFINDIVPGPTGDTYSGLNKDKADVGKETIKFKGKSKDQNDIFSNSLIVSDKLFQKGKKREKNLPSQNKMLKTSFKERFAAKFPLAYRSKLAYSNWRKVSERSLSNQQENLGENCSDHKDDTFNQDFKNNKGKWDDNGMPYVSGSTIDGKVKEGMKQERLDIEQVSGRRVTSDTDDKSEKVNYNTNYSRNISEEVPAIGTEENRSILRPKSISSDSEWECSEHSDDGETYEEEIVITSDNDDQTKIETKVGNGRNFQNGTGRTVTKNGKQKLSIDIEESHIVKRCEKGTNKSVRNIGKTNAGLQTRKNTNQSVIIHEDDNTKSINTIELSSRSESHSNDHIEDELQEGLQGQVIDDDYDDSSVSSSEEEDSDGYEECTVEEVEAMLSNIK